MADDARQIRIDLIHVECSGCRYVRTFQPSKPLVGASELATWLDEVPTPCRCGSQAATVKCRLAAEPFTDN